jgi:UDP-N-acetylglucosamine 2-epimerase
LNNLTLYVLESSNIPIELLDKKRNSENVTIIPLNHELAKKLKEKNIEIITEENILEFSDYAFIDKLTFELSTNWYNDTSKEKLLYDNIDIQKILHNELYQIFLRMVHRIVLLLKLIEKINPKIIKITNFDSILNEISINIIESKKIKYKILDTSANNKEIKDRFDKINFSVKLLGKNREFYLSQRNFEFIKKIYEKYWDIRLFLKTGFCNKKELNTKSFLLLDFNLLLHENFIKYLSEKKYNLLFINNRRPIIWNKKSLNIAKKIQFEKIKQNNVKIKYEETYEKFNYLIQKNFLHEKFDFSKIKLGKYFEKLILTIVKKRLSEFISKIEETKKLIKERKIDGVWALDDFGNDKIIVSVFQNYKIPVLAFLAGNLTYQQQKNITLVEPFVLDRTADKLLVWGKNDFKNCKETGVDLKKIVIGGAPRYEKFRELNTTDENYILILVGSFPSTAHSVFLSTSFILKFENKIKQVFIALKKINKKIILKRHPTQGINEIINFETLLLEIIPDATVLKEADTIDLISKSSLIITTPSTVVEESILLDKTIILLPYLYENEIIPYISTNAVIGINNIEDIDAKIHDCLYDEKTKVLLKHGRQKFIEKVFEFKDSASKRHDEIMNDIIKEINS